MARIEPALPPYEPRVVEDLDKLMPPGIPPIGLFRTLAKNPRVLRRFRRGGLLDPGSIDLREREIVILRATARAGAEYEWGVHVAFFADAAGLGDAERYATVHEPPTAACWSSREALLVRTVDALHERASICDELFAALRAELDEDQIIEVLTLAGLYRMVSYLVTGLGVELEPGAARFPPR